MRIGRQIFAFAGGLTVSLATYSALESVEFFLPHLKGFGITASVRVEFLAHAPCFLDLSHRNDQLKS